jgi:hypothetical protein
MNNSNLDAWKKFNDSSLEMIADLLLSTAKGGAEKVLHGSVSARYDHSTVRAITEAVGKIRNALGNSQAVWLPGAEETQACLPVDRSDPSFQSFLKTLGNSIEVKDGGQP